MNRLIDGHAIRRQGAFDYHALNPNVVDQRLERVAQRVARETFQAFGAFRASG
jgi:hypothetical protein